jgi:serine/threonine protein phosphatase 1
MDTGAGWAGKLTIMDVQTKEYWQSDPVQSLYPDAVPRRTVRKLNISSTDERRS